MAVGIHLSSQQEVAVNGCMSSRKAVTALREEIVAAHPELLEAGWYRYR